MINKIYKRIHNKYSRLFNFIFFLRYLFGIFFISVILFLSIPHFFDYKKKDEIIKKYLLESYGLQLLNYENIKYNSFPIPSLDIQNALNLLSSDSIQLETKNLKIYPSLLNIYDFKNFNAKKITLDKNKVSLEVNKLNILSNYIHKIRNKINLNDLELKIFKEDKFLINFEKIYFSNYGYNKNIIKGKTFNKNFKIIISDGFSKINFKLLKTGIDVDLSFNEIKEDINFSGIIKARVLNSNSKFNFSLDDEKFEINNFYFRSKNLSFNNISEIFYSPFFSISSNYNIEDVNIELFKSLDLNKILNLKKIIKIIKNKNIINYKSKLFSNSLVDDLNLNINLAHGRLTYSKKILISDNLLTCSGDVNLLDEYPILYFICSITAKDKKKLLKEFSIKYKNKNEPLNLNIKGSINILNNKINFKKIIMDKDYEGSREELIYFKDTFERTLFDEDFLNIFNLKKIKKFILEIS